MRPSPETGIVYAILISFRDYNIISGQKNNAT